MGSLGYPSLPPSRNFRVFLCKCPHGWGSPDRNGANMKLFPWPLNPAAISLALKRPGDSSYPPAGEHSLLPKGAFGAEERVSRPHQGFLKSLSGDGGGSGEKYLGMRDGGWVLSLT